MRDALFLSIVLVGLTCSSTSRAQRAGPTEVTVVREASPAESESFARRAFLRLRASGSLPVAGPRADLGNTGGAVALGAGAHLVPAVAVGLEVELGVLPESAADGAGVYTTTGVRGVMRLAVPLLELFHAFGALDAGLVLVRSQPAGGVSLRDAVPTWSVGPSVGLELDVLDGLSVEGGVRASFLRTSAAWQGEGDTLLISPFVGASWFF